MREGVGVWARGNLELVVLDILLDIGHEVQSLDPLVSPLIAPGDKFLGQHVPEPGLFFRKLQHFPGYRRAVMFPPVNTPPTPRQLFRLLPPFRQLSYNPLTCGFRHIPRHIVSIANTL